MQGQGGIFIQNWHDNVLRLIAEIDRCIRAREGETLTLAHLARLLDCSQSQVSHQFHALTGTSLRDFVQARRPALALPAVRDGEQRLLDIALDCGFSSQEAFTRAFRAAYGITPGEYRRSPRPLSLRTVIPAAGLLSRRAGSRRHGKRYTDVFYHASGAQICTHSQL